MEENVKLRALDAYKAMYLFLEHEYNLTGSDDIAGLLGSMSILTDGSTADPHMIVLWHEILNKVQIEEQFSLQLKQEK